MVLYLFNKDLNNWDTSKCNNMYGMLMEQGVYNNDIGAWNTLQGKKYVHMYAMRHGFYITAHK